MRTLFLLFSIFAASANAGENQTILKDRPGRNQVIANCSLCHSLDYITMNAKILDRAGWEKTVGKMLNVMGAPIDDAGKQTLIDYLAQNYGK